LVTISAWSGASFEMARSAGVTPIVVLTGHLDREEARELGMEHIVEDVTLVEGELAKL